MEVSLFRLFILVLLSFSGFKVSAQVSQTLAGGFITGNCDATCQSGQRLALQAMYNGLQGTGWQSQNGWTSLPANSGTPAMDYCSWAGVGCCTSNLTYSLNGYTAACYTANAIVVLSLSANGLQGVFPAAAKASLFKTLEYCSLAGV